MSVADSVRRRVNRIPRGEPFTIDRVAKLVSRKAASKALSRMVETGLLRRPIPGVYHRPYVSRLFGEVPATAEDVMMTIAAARGHTIQVHGSEAVRKFRLSTQMQTTATYYTSGPTREIIIGNRKIRLIHASASRLQKAGTIVGLAISALYYLSNDERTRASLEAITSRLQPDDLTELLRCQLPGWAEKELDTSLNKGKLNSHTARQSTTTPKNKEARKT